VKSIFRFAILGTAGSALLSVASAQVIINETFESYANTLAMQATWVGTLGTLDPSFGNLGQSAFHPGGTVNSFTGFSIAPSGTQYIKLSADIYDDATSANKRITVGLRTGADPLFEMGMYNSPSHYSTRVLNFSGSPNWVAIPAQGSFVNAPVAGWHHWTAEIYNDHTTVSLDLFGDGILDATYTTAGPASANPFTDLRFGGPSNLSSAGGGAWFDNIRLEVVQVPEPSSLTLGVIGLGLLAWRRRQTS